MSVTQIVGLIGLAVTMVTAPYITSMFAALREWHVSDTNRVVVIASAFTTALSWATAAAIVIHHIAVQPHGVPLSWWGALAGLLIFVGLVITCVTFSNMHMTVVDSGKSQEDNRYGRLRAA